MWFYFMALFKCQCEIWKPSGVQKYLIVKYLNDVTNALQENIYGEMIVLRESRVAESTVQKCWTLILA